VAAAVPYAVPIASYGYATAIPAPIAVTAPLSYSKTYVATPTYGYGYATYAATPAHAYGYGVRSYGIGAPIVAGYAAPTIIGGYGLAKGLYLKK